MNADKSILAQNWEFYVMPRIKKFSKANSTINQLVFLFKDQARESTLNFRVTDPVVNASNMVSVFVLLSNAINPDINNSPNAKPTQLSELDTLRMNQLKLYKDALIKLNNNTYRNTGLGKSPDIQPSILDRNWLNGTFKRRIKYLDGKRNITSRLGIPGLPDDISDKY
jgi:hypothetical protein